VTREPVHAKGRFRRAALYQRSDEARRALPYRPTGSSPPMRRRSADPWVCGRSRAVDGRPASRARGRGRSRRSRRNLTTGSSRSARPRPRPAITTNSGSRARRRGDCMSRMSLAEGRATAAACPERRKRGPRARSPPSTRKGAGDSPDEDAAGDIVPYRSMNESATREPNE
jgi:hypothetical protein